jgi:hypothetical protein
MTREILVKSALKGAWLKGKIRGAYYNNYSVPQPIFRYNFGIYELTADMTNNQIRFLRSKATEQTP